MTELHNFDIIPDPKIIEAALRACRRVNDYALTLRFLEAIKIKCGSPKNRKIMYPWLMEQVRSLFLSPNPPICIAEMFAVCSDQADAR